MNNMMQFEGVALILALLAVVVFFAGFKFLASSNWIVGWLRGNFGMALVLLAAAMVLFLSDIRTYQPMFDDKAIATISFDQLSPGNYQMRLVDVNGIESRYSLTGDRWYISINQFKWSTRFSGMGLGHGYRLGSVGAFKGFAEKTESVEQDIVIGKSQHIDSWQWIRAHIPADFFITAVLVRPDPEPMIAGAIYEVIPSGATIFIKPVNEVAIKATVPAASVVPSTDILSAQQNSPAVEQATPERQSEQPH